MNPLVSIIVPNYNHAAYLPKRLSSIAAQTFTNYELILLDDASADDSPTLLANFAKTHANTQYIANTTNSGSPFKQWNKGVALAKGAFIWIAESDDYCEPDLLEKLVPLLRDNPQVGIAYGQSYLVNEKDEILHSYAENLEHIYKSKAWETNFIESGPKACRKWLVHHNPIPNASGILFRKSAYLQAGGATENMRLNGDWFLYTKILVTNDLAFTAQHLNYFRVHTQTQRVSAIKHAWVYNELVTINNYIRQNISNSQAAADVAITEVGNWWIGSLPYQKPTRQNWQTNKVLYQFFKPYRNNLPYRIFLTYLISYLRDFLKCIGLLKPLKRLRSWLIPGKYWDK